VDWLQSVCNWIIIIGGTLVAIKTISEWIGKPIRFVKNRQDENFENQVKSVLNKVMPSMLLAHDLEIKDKYLADRERYLREIEAEVLKDIKSELDTVANLKEQYGGLKDQYEALVISAKDVLREKIMAVYHKNKGRRKIDESEKEALDQYYKDYKAIKGNSYIDKYYARMKRWTVVPEEYCEEEDDENE
jgi:hypothetical protein